MQSWTQLPLRCRCRRWRGSWRTGLLCWPSCTPSLPAHTSRWGRGEGRACAECLGRPAKCGCRALQQLALQPAALLPFVSRIVCYRSILDSRASHFNITGVMEEPAMYYLLVLECVFKPECSEPAGLLEEPAGGSRLHGPAPEHHAARLPPHGRCLSRAGHRAAALQVGELEKGEQSVGLWAGRAARSRATVGQLVQTGRFY